MSYAATSRGSGVADEDGARLVRDVPLGEARDVDDERVAGGERTARRAAALGGRETGAGERRVGRPRHGGRGAAEHLAEPELAVQTAEAHRPLVPVRAHHVGERGQQVRLGDADPCERRQRMQRGRALLDRRADARELPLALRRARGPARPASRRRACARAAAPGSAGTRRPARRRARARPCCPARRPAPRSAGSSARRLASGSTRVERALGAGPLEVASHEQAAARRRRARRGGRSAWCRRGGRASPTTRAARRPSPGGCERPLEAGEAGLQLGARRRPGDVGCVHETRS